MRYKIEVYRNGLCWIKKNGYHRLDGPACESEYGSRIWCKNNLLHCKDGPAREYAIGYKEWYIDGVKYSEEEFNRVKHEI